MAGADDTTPVRGLLVTFEGGEGAGKSTQVGRLRARLAASGRDVVATREPGGSPRAEAIRAGLLAGHGAPFGPFAEALLFAAARADHVDRTIRPAIDRGAIVLCDRFIDSTRVYQGAVAGLPAAALARLESASIAGLLPDLTLVFDLPAELGMARARRRRELAGDSADRFEGEGLAYHLAIREAFLAIAAAEPARCVLIDASAEADTVEAAIWRAVAPLETPRGIPSPLRSGLRPAGGPSRSEAEDRGGGSSVVPQRSDPHPARPLAESALPARGRVDALEPPSMPDDL